ncbi:MAG: aminodeoxychorismate synthase component I, partial [Oxalobacter sp.]
SSISQEQEDLPDAFQLTEPVTLLNDKEAYIAKIKLCQAYIQQGETYEVCLTNTVYGATDADPWTVYRMLRRRNPAPYSAFMQFTGFSILSCSPERFLKITRSGTAMSKPIKGTRPRLSDESLDTRMKQELVDSEKELAENLMIVDLVRHDLGWTAEIGSVRVPELFAVESYQTVHQLVSTITSEIRQDSSPCQCVRYAFPGGSMTGAPKKRTMELLDNLENAARGIYSGALGYFSLCGAIDLSIVIRTLVVSKDGRFSLGVGGAITALSDPDEEFEETQVKAKAFLDLFNTGFPDT